MPAVASGGARDAEFSGWPGRVFPVVTTVGAAVSRRFTVALPARKSARLVSAVCSHYSCSTTQRHRACSPSAISPLPRSAKSLEMGSRDPAVPPTHPWHPSPACYSCALDATCCSCSLHFALITMCSARFCSDASLESNSPPLVDRFSSCTTQPSAPPSCTPLARGAGEQTPKTAHQHVSLCPQRRPL